MICNVCILVHEIFHFLSFAKFLDSFAMFYCTIYLQARI